MEHTYLRYECADAFGITSSSASSKAPQSNSILAFLGNSPSSPLLTTAGSQCVGFNLRQCLPCLKLGHRERLTGGIGTGRALNSDEVVCMDTYKSPDGAKVATGWVDGAVRVFELNADEIGNTSKLGLVHSLLEEENDGDEFAAREPLILNGHSQTPVRSIAFDRGTSDSAGTRLASGGSDGSVVVWDIVAETGLFRLLGHRGAITDVIFFRVEHFDGLITSSLDGLVKIWDLDGQCCTQTIASHRGEVLGSACMKVFSGDAEDEDRWRMVTGSTDGQVRVWSVQPPKRVSENSDEKDKMEDEHQDANKDDAIVGENNPAVNEDDVCHYMGSLIPPPNVATSAEKVASIHYHPNGRFVGVLHANSKNVDVYQIRSAHESMKKKQRRLRRRREKQGKANVPAKGQSGRKRGILDDPESSGDENDKNEDTANDVSLDPELTKASDEFEYFGTIRASHKLRGFIFLPFKERGSGIKVACSLSTNAVEVHSIFRKKTA